MNKKNYFIIVLVLISNLIFAQSLETVMWGTKAELPKKTSFQKIAGTNSDGFYAIRSDDPRYITKDKIWLEYVSFATLTVDESNEITFPSIGGKQSYYEDLFFINDKLILFTSIEDKSRNEKVLYISYLNTNGTVKNKPKEVASIPLSNMREDGFKFKFIKDTKEIMLYYHKTYAKYNGEKFKVKMFDSNLRETFFEELVFPKELMNRTVELLQLERGKQGDLYFLLKAEQLTTRRSTLGGTKYDFILLAYYAAKKEFKFFKIEVLKNVVKDMRFAINEKGNIIFGGLLAPRSSRIPGQIGGMFYSILNLRTQKFISSTDIKKTTYNMLRDKAIASSFNDDRTGDTPLQRNSFFVRSIELLENGGLMVVCEQYYEDSREFKDPETKEIVKVKYFHYNDLMIGGVDKNGKFAWVKRYPKMQFSTEDGGYFSSYAIYTNVNTVKIMYNDDPKNIKNDKPEKTKTIKFNFKTYPKGIAVIESIYNDGSFQKTPMFQGDEGKCVIVPKTFTEFQDGFLIYTLSGKEYRFAQFVFE